MNRTIKFRVWDKAERDFTDLSDYESRHWFDRSDADPIYDSLIIQQFTGLIDRKGVEIYEGDIIQIDSYQGKIAWNKRGCGWVCEDLCETITPINVRPLTWYMIEKCCVVGNIFENPELLK